MSNKVQGIKKSPAQGQMQAYANLVSRTNKVESTLRGIDSYVKEVKDSVAHSHRVAEMLVAPSERLTKAPTSFPARGATRHFTRTVTLNATGAGESFGISVNSDLSNFYTIAGGTTNEAVAGLKLFFNGTGSGVTVTTEDATSARPLTVSSPSATEDGFTRYNWTTGAVGNLNYLFVGNKSSKHEAYAVVRCYHDGAAPGYADFSWYLYPDEAYQFATTATSGVNTWLGVGIKVVDFEGSPLPYIASVVDNLATAIQSDSLSRPLVRDEWLDKGQVLKYRISALSLLATYRGNMLENAGVIAACRAPVSWRPDAPNLYSAICKLPEDRYKGPLLEGAYCWWLPTDFEELDFRSVHDPFVDATGLFIGGEFGDANGALEITIDVVVDFYSPLQIFERKVFPIMHDSYYSMYANLSLLPAATCNPKHLDILKKGIKAGSRGIMKGIDFARSNPELVSLFIKMLAGLAV